MLARKQTGFTLVELLISVVILGVLMAIIGPIFSNALTFMESAKKSEIQLNNQKLAAGMLSYARNKGGKLPPERSGDKYTLYSATAVAADGDPYELYLELTGAGVPPNQINSTGYGMDTMKMYQVVGGLTHKQPMFFFTGDEVTLTYQVGVIYQSNCAKGDACSGAPFSGGRTPQLTASNITSWNVEGGDFAPVMMNTLAEQKTMLRATIGRLNRLSDRLSSHYYAKARAAQDKSENHFAGANPLEAAATADGCWTQWEDLSLNNGTLESIGLDRNEYGKTAWGGAVEYCRDYKPSGAGGSSPFFAALRINKDLSSSLSPAGVSSNIIVTF